MSPLWIAIGAAGDDVNAEGTEIIGVFSSEAGALAAVRERWPHTGEALAFELDTIPEWAKPDA